MTETYNPTPYDSMTTDNEHHQPTMSPDGTSMSTRTIYEFLWTEEYEWAVLKVVELQQSTATHAKGLYIMTDSGCSCGCPFEYYDGLDEATGPLTRSQAIEECETLTKHGYSDNPDREMEAFINRLDELGIK